MSVCLVILEFCLLLSSSSSLSVVYVLAPAYTSLCRDLKYLPKVRYIILVDLLWAGFLIFETVFLGRSATLPYAWKIHHKNEWHLCLGCTYPHQTFTEYISNWYTHFDILTFQMWLQVMECHLILLRPLGIFIHYYWLFMSELLYHLHQTFTDCVSHQYWYSKCQMWLQSMENLSILLRFFLRI